ncbi:hypothetical protein [Proteus phage vB_PmiP_RS51pmB]|nr:hypothetical protein [Proteus phage vB_PmiP_RS51pmB]
MKIKLIKYEGPWDMSSITFPVVVTGCRSGCCDGFFVSGFELSSTSTLGTESDGFIDDYEYYFNSTEAEEVK